MIVVKTYTFRTSKDDSTGALFQRVWDALAESGLASPSIRFHLQDNLLLPYGRTVSACERVIKTYPDLRAFLFTQTDGNQLVFGQLPQTKTLSNLDGRWHIPNPNDQWACVSAQTLHEVAQGIPRSYPFQLADFVFDRVPCLSLAAETEGLERFSPAKKLSPLLPMSFSPVVRLTWDKFPGKKGQIYLSATIVMDPPQGDALPKIPSTAQRLLEQLGRVYLEDLKTFPSLEEERRFKEIADSLQAIGSRYRDENLLGMVKEMPLPFDLPPRQDVPFRCDPYPISCKPALVKVFKPRGYRYVSKMSGHGMYWLAKRTPLNNCIELSFDVGSYSSSVMCFMFVKGPFGAMGVPFPVTLRAVPHIMSYPILDEPFWEKVTANCGVIVDYLERTFVAEVESLCGPAPAWFPCAY